MVNKDLRDGAVSAQRLPDGNIALHADDKLYGGQHILVTEFNARRLLGALSAVLDLPLSARSQKAIKMG